MGGDVLAQCRYGLEPNREMSIQALEEVVKKAASVKGLLLSRNQQVKMFLDGSTYQLPGAGVVWSNWASFCPPSIRLVGKIDLAGLRFSRWIEALRQGSACLVDDPTLLA